MATPKTAAAWQPPADPDRLRLTPEEASQLVASVRASHKEGDFRARERKQDRARRSADFLEREINALTDYVEKSGRIEPLASESRHLAEIDAAYTRLNDAINEWSRPVPPPAAILGGGAGLDDEDFAEGKPLARGQSFAGYARARGYRDGLDEFEDADLNLGKILRGSMTGDWRNAEAERQAMNAMTGGTGAAGGFLIPTLLSGQIIDLARAKTRVIEAGASVVPMDSRTVDVPRWDSDPTLSWRGENTAVGESDATLSKVTLNARSLATVVRVTRELVEDTDIRSPLMNAFAAALALKIDSASLYGSGTIEPTGVKVNSSVTKTALGANGASPTFDALVDSVGRLRDNNEEPTAQILADRTARSLSKLKDTAGNYLTPPAYLDDVPRLATSAIPVNLTTGTNSDTSDVFTGDWRQLIIGIRIGLRIEVLSERYMTTNTDGTGGQYGFLAWWRGDIVVARPKAFDVVTGVRP